MMPLYTDQMNRVIELPDIPKRIISLVPSQTELLSDLGLDEEVIGITKFCLHPEQWFRNKTRIGGTKTVKTGLVASLKPDLIIANKEENIKEQIEALENIAPVWISDIQNTEQALNMIESIGSITGKTVEVCAIINKIKNSFSNLLATQPGSKTYRTAYFIWKDPYMTVGGDTFINDIMKMGGFENVFAVAERYPQIALDELKEKQPDIILLSSEPFPFRQKHIAELQTEFPGVKIILADGEMFSWYGSRMLYTADYILQLRNELSQSGKQE